MPGLLDAVHQAPCPNEFGTQDAKSEQDYEPARARRHDHHEPQENDGKPDERDGDAPSLFERAEEHRIENTSAAPANELKSWSMQKKTGARDCRRPPRYDHSGFYCSGTSSTRRFWARPSAVSLGATKSVLPKPWLTRSLAGIPCCSR